jgi:hypothetical protein
MEHIFFFTPEQVREFELILHNHSDRNIEKFVSAIDEYCHELSRIKTLPGAHAKRITRDRQQAILADIQLALTHLQSYGADREKGALPESIEETIYSSDRYTAECTLKNHEAVNLFLKAAAWKAIPALVVFRDELEATIERNSQDRGRPSPIAGEVIEKIAWFYDMYLTTPTMYAKGGFYTIVSLVLEIMGLPSGDPTRQIRTALTKHRNKCLTIKNR